MPRSTPRTIYAVAIGSNRYGKHGRPEAEVRAAIAALKGKVSASPVLTSAPLGPSARRFANAVALVETKAPPETMLHRLKAIESDFGRRPGQRWGARVIDLDIILWSGGAWHGPALTIPHIAYRARTFVLAPLAQLAPNWRDPFTHLTARQLLVRLTRRRALPRRIAHW